MRRFAAAGTRADLDRCTRLLAMAPAQGGREAADGGIRGRLRRPIAGGFAGRPGRRRGEVQRAVAHHRPAAGQAGSRRGSRAAAGRRPRRRQQAAADPPGPGRGPPAVGRAGHAEAGLPLGRQRPPRRRAIGPRRVRQPGHRRRGARRLSQHVRRRPVGRPDLAGDPAHLGRPVRGGDRGPVDRRADGPARDRREARRAGGFRTHGSRLARLRSGSAVELRRATRRGGPPGRGGAVRLGRAQAGEADSSTARARAATRSSRRAGRSAPT